MFHKSQSMGGNSIPVTSTLEGCSKAWGFENSTRKDKMGSNMTSTAVEFANNMVASEAVIRISNVSSDSNVLPLLKPPLGLPPLKPPPGRKDLLPPFAP